MKFQKTVRRDFDATTLLRAIPQAGQLYVGDVSGTPMALEGILGWRTYLEHRDKIRQGEAKWVDNTLRFAAEVYNGGLPVVERYAHISRVIYDKHWDGRNRTKNPNLTNEEREGRETCHLCGGIDSQAHAFRRCSHSNISAIRQEVRKALDEYVDNLKSSPIGSDSQTIRKNS